MPQQRRRIVAVDEPFIPPSPSQLKKMGLQDLKHEAHNLKKRLEWERKQNKKLITSALCDVVSRSVTNSPVNQATSGETPRSHLTRDKAGKGKGSSPKGGGSRLRPSRSPEKRVHHGQDRQQLMNELRTSLRESSPNTVIEKVREMRQGHEASVREAEELGSRLVDAANPRTGCHRPCYGYHCDKGTSCCRMTTGRLPNSAKADADHLWAYGAVNCHMRRPAQKSTAIEKWLKEQLARNSETLIDLILDELFEDTVNTLNALEKDTDKRIHEAYINTSAKEIAVVDNAVDAFEDLVRAKWSLPAPCEQWLSARNEPQPIVVTMPEQNVLDFVEPCKEKDPPVRRVLQTLQGRPKHKLSCVTVGLKQRLEAQRQQHLKLLASEEGRPTTTEEFSQWQVVRTIGDELLEELFESVADEFLHACDSYVDQVFMSELQVQ